MRLLATALLLVSSPSAFAGVFSPNEPCPFEISPDGTATPLPLNVFKLFLNDRVAALQATGPDIQSGSADTPTFRGGVLQRLRSAPASPSRAEMVGLSADLLRAGRSGEVVELLKPVLRDRTLDYRLLAHLSLAHAALGDWDLALLRHANAVGDSEAPIELGGTKPEQLKWMLKVDRTHTRPWLKAAQRDASPATKTADPDVPPLFKMDALPADAVAIAQQLVLWSPRDNNLLWLLGAVHLAKGQIEAAFDILEQCRERKMTWPKFRADHANAEALYRALPKPPADEALVSTSEFVEADPPKRGLFAVVDPTQFALALGGFSVVVLGLFALQLRKWRRLTASGSRPG